MGYGKMKVVLQSENAECGNACLVMIANQYGIDIHLPQLRKLNPTSIDAGISIRQIAETAQLIGLHTSAVKYEPAHPEELDLPCILHWGGNHFVVVEAVSQQKIGIIDPALGRRQYSREQFEDMATGFALELIPNLSKQVHPSDLIDNDKHKGVNFADIRKMMPGFKNSLSLILFVTFCTAIISLFSPLYVQKVVDEAISKGNIDLLFVLSTIFAAIFFHEMIFSYVTELAKNSLKFRLGEKLGIGIFSKLVYLPIDYFKRRRTGDCLARIKSSEVVAGFLVDGVLAIITASIIIALTISVMFYFNPMLAMLSLGIMALFGSAKFAFKSRVIEAEKLAVNEAAKADSIAIDTIKSVKTVKAFSNENSKKNQWGSQYATSIAAALKRQKLNIVLGSLSKLFLSSELILIVTVGGLQVIDGEMSLGTLFAFIMYKNIFTEQVIILIESLILKNSIEVHLERVNDIISESSEIENASEKPTKLVTQSKSGKKKVRLLADAPQPGLKISAEALTFSPLGSERKILEDINLQIRSCEKVCIVGKTGSGKTTLTNIISGLHKQSSGQLMINDIDTDTVTLINQRACFSTLSQDDYIFAGTLEENIALTSYDIDYPLLEHVCKLSLIYDDIQEMTCGYKTMLTENSGFLSAGQKQRVLIARALYKNPQCLILDEFTSNLDIKTSQKLVNNIINNVHSTLIVITHDTSIIDRFDSTYLIRNGRLRKLKQQEANHESAFTQSRVS
ncbi:peptidase domain-containing ABC transporter [Veronia pacifica]|uniref:ABC transporter ATP-binding protein n=1 Tax=Veronia pacifica TaxID=1080227 RepID=A0A1C3E952_9GAMM|nr:peptidase domain-containing ABC transporter [Veronia pacifica]ODA29763.1 hypothetical protein A8L45_21800 [Veronia pacifica]